MVRGFSHARGRSFVVLCLTFHLILQPVLSGHTALGQGHVAGASEATTLAGEKAEARRAFNRRILSTVEADAGPISVPSVAVDKAPSSQWPVPEDGSARSLIARPAGLASPLPGSSVTLASAPAGRPRPSSHRRLRWQRSASYRTSTYLPARRSRRRIRSTDRASVSTQANWFSLSPAVASSPSFSPCSSPSARAELAESRLEKGRPGSKSAKSSQRCRARSALRSGLDLTQGV